MYTVRFNTKKAKKTLDNVVSYSEGFIKETKARESTIASRLANISINAFYDYLDVLARTNPSMLHHIYEWGQVGDPEARLVELKKNIKGSSVDIAADFIQSSSIPDGSSEPFYNKAEIMEDGIPITVQEVDAKAMFFEIDGEEYFRVGPIVIENPGGEEARGSFVREFEQFYNTYFDRVYLQAIRFYDHFSNPTEYEKNFKNASKSLNADSIGRTTALKWILTMPGDDSE